MAGGKNPSADRWIIPQLLRVRTYEVATISEVKRRRAAGCLRLFRNTCFLFLSNGKASLTAVPKAPDLYIEHGLLCPSVKPHLVSQRLPQMNDLHIIEPPIEVAELQLPKQANIRKGSGKLFSSETSELLNMQRMV